MSALLAWGPHLPSIANIACPPLALPPGESGHQVGQRWRDADLRRIRVAGVGDLYAVLRRDSGAPVLPLQYAVSPPGLTGAGGSLCGAQYGDMIRWKFGRSGAQYGDIRWKFEGGEKFVGEVGSSRIVYQFTAGKRS